MCPVAFQGAVEQAKKAGKVPFFAIATMGTTVLGAFDPVREIADICRKEDIWLHVDVGAFLGFSKIPEN